MGDFSMKANDNVVSDFIDITFAKKPQSFQQFCVIETSLSDLHRMTVFAMKTAFDKLYSRVLNLRDCKYFETDSFQNYFFVRVR